MQPDHPDIEGHGLSAEDRARLEVLGQYVAKSDLPSADDLAVRLRAMAINPEWPSWERVERLLLEAASALRTSAESLDLDPRRPLPDHSCDPAQPEPEQPTDAQTDPDQEG